MIDAVLRADRLRKNFGDKEVLRGIDLAIEPGTMLGLLGANGSSKTTLIKCAFGLLRPTAGTVTVLGEDSWNLSGAAKAGEGPDSRSHALRGNERIRSKLAARARALRLAP